MASGKIILQFSADTSDKPVIYHLVKDYDLIVNIIKARINPEREGKMVLELTGQRYDEGIEYLQNQNIKVQRLAEQIIHNDERCSSCGACTDACPTEALYIQRPSMQVAFDSDKCVVCQLCIKLCPLKAMEVRF